MTVPMPTSDRDSWTHVGQDIEDAGVYAMIIPAVTHKGWLKWAFWFQKFPTQRPVPKPLVALLSKMGTVFVVRYSSDGNPMKVVNAKTGEETRVNRSQLHEMMRQHGEIK